MCPVTLTLYGFSLPQNKYQTRFFQLGSKGYIHCLRMRFTEVWKLIQRFLEQLLTNKAVECPVLKGVSRCLGGINGAWLHPIPCAKLFYHVLSIATHPEGFHGWVSESDWLHFFLSFCVILFLFVYKYNNVWNMEREIWCTEQRRAVVNLNSFQSNLKLAVGVLP